MKCPPARTKSRERLYWKRQKGSADAEGRLPPEIAAYLIA
jgi:hypothetical protein